MLYPRTGEPTGRRRRRGGVGSPESPGVADAGTPANRRAVRSATGRTTHLHSRTLTGGSGRPREGPLPGARRSPRRPPPPSRPGSASSPRRLTVPCASGTVDLDRRPRFEWRMGRNSPTTVRSRANCPPVATPPRNNERYLSPCPVPWTSMSRRDGRADASGHVEYESPGHWYVCYVCQTPVREPECERWKGEPVHSDCARESPLRCVGTRGRGF